MPKNDISDSKTKLKKEWEGGQLLVVDVSIALGVAVSFAFLVKSARYTRRSTATTHPNGMGICLPSLFYLLVFNSFCSCCGTSCLCCGILACIAPCCHLCWARGRTRSVIRAFSYITITAHYFSNDLSFAEVDVFVFPFLSSLFFFLLFVFCLEMQTQVWSAWKLLR